MEIEAVLDRMERAGVTIQDLKCQVTYQVKDEINDDTRTRKGEIRFLDQKPNPIFYVHFDKLVQDGAVHRDDEWYVFDGTTLWEAKSKTRVIVKRELVAKGQHIDLFDIEQSPIPIPFGQRKAEILNSFNVKMLPSSPGDPRETIHLACTPKESSRLTKEYDKIEFFVCQTVNLPIRIITTRKGGDQVETADFPDLTTGSMNNGMTSEEVRLPHDVAGYQVIEEKLGQDR